MKYTIITINYNNADGLRRTIESVVNQTYRDFEYIIIDGGSTDGSVEVIKEYADRIDYWVSEPDKGIYNAMNKGILQAHGEYLNFMNSGDYFYSLDVLQVMVTYLRQDVILGRDYRMIDGMERNHGFYKKTISLIDLWAEPLNHQSAFIKKELFEDRKYDESYKMLADQKFFLDTLVFSNSSFENVDVAVVKYDMTGISAKQDELYRKEREMLFRDLLPERIYCDYVNFGYVDVSLLMKLAQISRTYTLYKIASKGISLLVSIKGLLLKLRK